MERKMDYEFRDKRLSSSAPRRRSSRSRRGWRKIEGQVRAIRQMIEEGCYCGDELLLSNAVTAAMREVAILIASQHLQTGVRHAAAQTVGSEKPLGKRGAVIADTIGAARQPCRFPPNETLGC
jgi:DNA-binding FrmR family transcriptional regulator